MYSSNPRRVGIYITYTWASRWASIHIGSIYSNTPPQSELPAQRCSRLDNKKANKMQYKREYPVLKISHNKKLNLSGRLVKPRTGKKFLFFS